MKKIEGLGSSDLQTHNGHVTLYDGRGRVVGYVDPMTRIQTDIHGQAVRTVPVSGRAGAGGSPEPRRSRATNGELDGRR